MGYTPTVWQYGETISAERMNHLEQGLADATVIWPSNRNILDNWYLLDLINQREMTGPVGSGYAIDRWFFNRGGSESSITVDENGISAVAADGYVDLNQRIEHYQQLVGKRCTVSAIIDDELYSYTFSFGNMSSAGADFVSPRKVVFYSNPDSATYHFLFRVATGNSAVFKAVKLELGTVQTLAHKENGQWVLNDAPPNRALELLKCQRYFQLFSSADARPTKARDFRPPLYKEPTLGTIVINGVTYYTAVAEL